jgi:hypothetical protein
MGRSSRTPAYRGSCLVAVLILGICRPLAAQTDAPAPPPVASVFREMPRDLWRFMSWDTALVLGAGAGAAGIGHIWDDDLANEVETERLAE